MFAGHKVVCYCNITIFVVATPSRHRDLNIFRIFLVPEALLRWRVVVVALLLSHCRFREAKKLLRAQLCKYETSNCSVRYPFVYKEAVKKFRCPSSRSLLLWVVKIISFPHKPHIDYSINNPSNLRKA